MEDRALEYEMWVHLRGQHLHAGLKRFLTFILYLV